jgi:hypothetical protein
LRHHFAKKRHHFANSLALGRLLFYTILDIYEAWTNLTFYFYKRHHFAKKRHHFAKNVIILLTRLTAPSHFGHDGILNT